MKKNLLMLSTALLLVGLIPLSLSAQLKAWKDVKLEFSTGISWEFSTLKTSYLNQYSPPFLSGPYVSHAEQTFNMQGKSSWGVDGVMTYYPTEHIGIQAMVEYGRPKLRGSNSPYSVDLNYALTTPASLPYPYVFQRTYGWPSTEGIMDELCVSLNAVARLPFSRRHSLNLSGGLTWFNVKAESAGIAYSDYWMEDAYFMGETFQLKVKNGPFNRLGLNLGAELNWIIFNTVALIGDFRFYSAPETKVAMDVLPNEMLTTPLAQVKTTMKLGSIQIDPSFYRINIGLKYLF